MIRIVLIIALLGSSQIISAQEDSLTQIMEQFKTSFNQQDSEQSYSLGSDYFKEQISKEMWTNILDQYFEAFGALNSLELLEQKEGRGLFMGHFENGDQKIGLAINKEDLIVGFRFLPNDTPAVASMERNKTPMSLPVKGDWFVFWGGDTKAQNYHVVSTAQKNAFDILKLGPNNKSHKNKGYYNEDYYAFGQPLYAAADGVAVKVVTGVEDNIPGKMNPGQMLGNAVIIKTANEEFLVYAHFQKGSLEIKEGDTISRGQYLGNCGNSGNSSEPHLHFHIQDGLNMLNSVGIKCYFDQLKVKDSLKEDYSPVRLDRISDVNN